MLKSCFSVLVKKNLVSLPPEAQNPPEVAALFWLPRICREPNRGAIAVAPAENARLVMRTGLPFMDSFLDFWFSVNVERVPRDSNEGRLFSTSCQPKQVYQN